MIRGYVAFVDRDSPLPEVTPDSCRKAGVKLTVDHHEFYLKIKGRDLSFKVARNIRAVDKHDIASGLVRIGFIIPDLDIVISCNPGDLKAFVYTLEVVKDIVLPPRCSDRTHKRELKCICQGPKFSQYQRYHISHYECPMSVHLALIVLGHDLCVLCCYRVLESYNDEDARKIINTWNTYSKTAGLKTLMHSINVTSYPYLRTIIATGNNLTEIPESLGYLPCLRILGLSDNRLGESTNWNWLTSPFIRENLHHLYLIRNGLSNVPESVMGLRKLEVLSLSENHLSELPDALRKLKYLRELYIEDNKLVILPAWLYRWERFWCLYTENNEFSQAGRLSKSKQQLVPKDFSIAVPSLFQTVAKYIITERLDFREYTIPATLTDYLEGAYHCRCGSVVFPDTFSPVLKCRIEARALSVHHCATETATILLRCCSYYCYQLIKPYVRL